MARTINANARRSTRQDEGTKQRDISDQPTPFLGLILAPFAALLFAWLIHYAIAGWVWHFGSNTMQVKGSKGFMTAAEDVAALGAAAVAVAAWRLSAHRDEAYRIIFTASVLFIGLWVPFLIGYGPSRWLDTFFIICAWIISAVWAQPRLHFLRRDPREDGNAEGEGDELMKQLGLTGYKAKGAPDVSYDQAGDATRIEVDIKHRFGGTRKPLQDAIDSLASAVGTKDGFVRVTAPDDGRSNHSIVTVVLKDPFVGRIPNPGPSHPGGSIADCALIGTYDDGKPVYVWIGGGINPTTKDRMPPSGYAFMGMTRAGKTVTENRLLLDGVITRRGGVILYLNKAKGGQDVQPIIAGVEAAVLSDNASDYTHALGEVERILTYRQKQLAAYGISAWSADKCFHNPPQVTLDGRTTPMEPMPALIVHVGEADAILEQSGEKAVYLASKGLSVGIIMGWSLQRWSSYSMPTDLRFNIGTAFCFGVGDDYSAAFALSEPTIKAGAHPEYWKNRKPGMFYVENIGIDENRFPVPAKGIGDVDDDALYLNMRLEAETAAPHMAHLDTGSVNATRGWWAKQVRITDTFRATVTPTTTPPAPAYAAAPAVQPVPDDPTPQEETPMRRPAPTAVFDANELPDDQSAAAMDADEQTRHDIDNTTEVNGQLIRGDLIKPDTSDGSDGTGYFDEIDAINPATPVAPPAEDDGVDLSEAKPEAPDRQSAELAFDEALRTAVADPRFTDPDDPNGSALIRTGQLQDLFRYRSRGWYSPILAEMADGKRMAPPGIRVERVSDRRSDGWYRLTDTTREPGSLNGYTE
jgi:hypothetical protein